MIVSESWLREWVNPQLSVQALSEQLSMAGLEVDGVSAVAGTFSGVVVGKVIDCEQHPNADRLKVATVDVGEEAPLTIVCGAKNCRTGIFVACAKIGAVLPDNFKIKKSKLREVYSYGMLCAYNELGIDIESEGIIELDENAQAHIGVDFRIFFNCQDSMIEIDLTPNRADCFSVKGIARELSVLNQIPMEVPNYQEVTVSSKEVYRAFVHATSYCPKYFTRVINHVDVSKPTPLWMVEKLRRSGIRSISIIVDITNLVLLELGHPLHAFDKNKLQGDIEVRLAHKEEEMTLLDGHSVTLQDDTLVIADEKGPIALAGIFGGLHSSVTDETQNIVLEAAYFAPQHIIGKARKYGLHTDSSVRYERGVDYNLQEIAMNRATQLILEHAGGEAGDIYKEISENNLPVAQPIVLHYDKVHRLLGCDIDTAFILKVLELLGCQLETVSDTHVIVLPPSFRFDLDIEETLIEEIARIYGYNNIPNQALHSDLTIKILDENKLHLDVYKNMLKDYGFNEVISYSFVEPNLQNKLFPTLPALTLPNPISSDMSVMRVSLCLGLLNTAKYNLLRQQSKVWLFESGLRFIVDENSENGVKQEPMLAAVISGKKYDNHWAVDNRAVNFYDLKAVLEKLLSATGYSLLSDFEFVSCEYELLHPKQSAKILYLGKEVGFIGTVHPKYEKQFGLTDKAIVFEIQVGALTNKKITQYQAISKYPTIKRDLSFVIESHISYQQVYSQIQNLNQKDLVDVELFDEYTGEHIQENYRSLSIAFTFQSVEKTLEEKEINILVDDIIDMFKQQFDADLRL